MLNPGVAINTKPKSLDYSHEEMNATDCFKSLGFALSHSGSQALKYADGQRLNALCYSLFFIPQGIKRSRKRKQEISGH